MDSEHTRNFLDKEMIEIKRYNIHKVHMLSNELFESFAGAHLARQIDKMERSGVSPDDPRYRALTTKLAYKDQNTKDRMEKTQGKIDRGEGADYDPNEAYVYIERTPTNMEDIRNRGYFKAYEDPAFPSIIGPEAEQRMKTYQDRDETGWSKNYPHSETAIEDDKAWWNENEKKHPRVSASRAGNQIGDLTYKRIGNPLNWVVPRRGYGTGDVALIKSNSAKRVPYNEYTNTQYEFISRNNNDRYNPNLEERLYPKKRMLYNQDQEDEKFRVGRDMTIRDDGSVYRGIGPKPDGYDDGGKQQKEIVGVLDRGIPITRKFGAIFRRPISDLPEDIRTTTQIKDKFATDTKYPKNFDPVTKDHPEFFQQPLNSTYPALNNKG